QQDPDVRSTVELSWPSYFSLSRTMLSNHTPLHLTRPLKQHSEYALCREGIQMTLLSEPLQCTLDQRISRRRSRGNASSSGHCPSRSTTRRRALSKREQTPGDYITDSRLYSGRDGALPSPHHASVSRL